MLRRRFTSIAVSLALLLVGAGSCHNDKEQGPELLLSITSSTTVDSIELYVRNFALTSDRTTVKLEGHDLTATPFTVLVQPRAPLSGQLVLAVKGYRNERVVAGATHYIRLEGKGRTELAVILQSDYRDDDNDGFPYATATCRDEGVCDCNDKNPLASPFRDENCADPADNNCVGGGNDDGCPCSLNDLPVVCSNLPANQHNLAGVGACYFGTLDCVSDPVSGAPVQEKDCHAGAPAFEDIPGNYIDDDCDGSVDEEGTPCQQGASRRCFLGFVDDASNPDEYERFGATKRLRGVCADYPGTQTCTNGYWGACLGSQQPQRVEEPAWGFAEVATQCNGLDDDCDGFYDEEFIFDNDGDGYTICGSTFNASPLDPTLNLHTQPGVSDYLVDCNDGDGAIHPNYVDDPSMPGYAVEVCEAIGIDEDCRCDHDDPNTTEMDIGDISCAPSYAYLKCDEIVRSGKNPVGTCDTDPPYLRGYADVDGSHGDCYVCSINFGRACSATTGACTTKEEDCTDCPTAATAVASELYQERPACSAPRAGTCVNRIEPQWDLVASGTDPYEDCGLLVCTDYHSPGDGGRCYRHQDVAAASVDCKEGGSCETAADVCAGAARSATALERAICTVAANATNCQGNTAFTPGFQGAGSDLFNDCLGYVCSDGSNNVGPYFSSADLTNDGQNNPRCYYRADVTDSVCGANGVCQSKDSLCLLSPRGTVEVPGRAACKTFNPAFTCGGVNGPLYTVNVADNSDPYEECASALTCNGNGACHLGIGATCGSSSDCESNACVDNRCCGSATCGTCQRCDVAGSLGTCTNVSGDNQRGCTGACNTCSSGTCTPQTGPSGYSCNTATTYCCSGACVAPNGEYGAACGAGECGSGTWQCSGMNAQCSTDGTACGACAEDSWRSNGTCALGACSGGSTGVCATCRVCSDDGLTTSCVLPGGYYQDASAPNTCNGTTACNAAGFCLNANGESCGAAGECASGSCVDGVCCAGACSTCQRCDVTGSLGTCTNVSGGNQRGCTGPCNICTTSGTCTAQTGASGYNCTTATTYCCSGVCVEPGGEYNTACGADDCVDGTWQCSVTSARCSTDGTACGACAEDSWRSNGACVLGVCSGGTTGVCDMCLACTDYGVTTSCVLPSGYYVDNSTPYTCNDTTACNGSGSCLTANGYSCAADGECASNNCPEATSRVCVEP